MSSFSSPKCNTKTISFGVMQCLLLEWTGQPAAARAETHLLQPNATGTSRSILCLGIRMTREFGTTDHYWVPSGRELTT